MRAPKSAKCSAIDHARANPSRVLVPRPISSNTTNECGVAACRMDAVSVISTMNVERPACNSSLAPIRVRMRSHRPIVAEAAGTYAPAWARRVSKAAVRMAVLLPAMLGPVTSANPGSLPPSLTSIGTNSAPNSRSNTGWRAPARSHSGDSIMLGRIDPSLLAVAANVASTSTSAISAAAAFKWLATAFTWSMPRSQSCCSRLMARSPAVRTFSSQALSSSVM